MEYGMSIMYRIRDFCLGTEVPRLSALGVGPTVRGTSEVQSAQEWKCKVHNSILQNGGVYVRLWTGLDSGLDHGLQYGLLDSFLNIVAVLASQDYGLDVVILMVKF